MAQHKIAAGGRASGPRSARRVAVAAGVGTVIEYYDFSVYGYLAVTISPLFFPNHSPVAALLSTLAIFATAFVVRPLGGIFFGRLGDRLGRRKLLLVTVLTMGVASTVTGLLPTYSSVGLLAPALLLLARLGQGFSAGGEVGGAATYIAECAPERKRGLYGACTPIGAATGFASAAACAGIVSGLLTDAQLSAWGWRIPFLVALPLGVFCLYIRLRLEDSPAFEALVENADVARTPIKDLLRTELPSVVRVAGLGTAQNAGAFISLTYMNIYLSNVLGYDASHTYWLTVAGAVFAAALMPLAGGLSDHTGRRRMLTIGLLAYVVVPVPAMALMGLDNFLLAGVAMLLLFLPFAVVQATGYPTYAELFSARVRYSGVALGFNIGALLGGGFAPYIATALVDATGNRLAPAGFLIVAALVGLLSMVRLEETAKAELR